MRIRVIDTSDRVVWKNPDGYRIQSNWIDSRHSEYSLIADMITGRYASGVPLSPKSFSDVFSLTRASARWIWNAQGQLVGVQAGQPCFEYDPVTGEALGLYLNGSAVTNVFTNSNFPNGTSDAPVSGGTPTTDTFPAPFNTALAMRNITADTYAYKPYAGFVDGGTYTFSCYVIMDDGGAPVIANGTSDANGDFGVVHVGRSADANEVEIIDRGSGLYQLNTTAAYQAGDNNWSGLIKRPGQSNRGFKFSGYQITNTSSPRHYIPTLGTAVTVAGDSCSLANLPIDYGTPGAIVFEWLDTGHPYNVNNVYLGFSGYRGLYSNPGGWSGDFDNIVTNDGANVISNFDEDFSIIRRSCLAWDSTTMKRSDNGQPVISAPHNGNLGTATAINLMSSSAGYVRRLQFIPSSTMMADSEIIQRATV